MSFTGLSKFGWFRRLKNWNPTPNLAASQCGILKFFDDGHVGIEVSGSAVLISGLVAESGRIAGAWRELVDGETRCIRIGRSLRRSRCSPAVRESRRSVRGNHCRQERRWPRYRSR